VKHAIIGTVLILYGLFLTPCVVEFSDAVVSPALIVAATSVGVPLFIIALWIISGYIALIIGASLLGHSILRRIPTIASGAKNPVALVLLVSFVLLVACFVLLGVI